MANAAAIEHLTQILETISEMATSHHEMQWGAAWAFGQLTSLVDIEPGDDEETLARKIAYRLSLYPDVDERVIVNVRTAAKMLQVHENTIRNWVESGLLTDVKIPGTRNTKLDARQIAGLAKERASTD